MRWLARRRFSLLLFALLLFVVVAPFSRALADVRIVFDVCLSVVFLGALAVVFRHHSTRLAALLLGIPPLLVQWTGRVLPDVAPGTSELGLHVLAALFFGFATAVIVCEVAARKSVTYDGVCGALCGYLLLGLIFGHLYTIAEFLIPGSFAGRPDLTAGVASESRRHLLLTYFSFVTLTTVGYGDITPASDAVRGLVVVEAMLGQFYLGVFIADLVGKKIAHTMATQPFDPS